jgi:hypothetical protein
MKPQLLMLAGASLLAAATVAHAESRSADELYLSVVGVQANAQLARYNLAPTREPLRVRAVLSGPGLSHIRVSPSTGDAAADKKIQRSLGRMRIGAPPAELDGQEITVTLSPKAEERAELRSPQPQ